VAEATVFTKGPTLRARESSPDMKASIDQLVDKLERQVTRYRERRTVEPRRHAEHNGVEPRANESREESA
jgi:putative sigma-54 modulation protein